MLIRIDSSIISDEDPCSWDDETVLSLERLASARFEGKHSIIGDRETLQKISECTNLSLNARRIYNKISYKSAQFDAYLSAVTKYIEVINPCVEPKLQSINCSNKQIIRVGPHFFKDSALSQKTILLCENLSDAAFYKKIAHVFLIWRRHSIVGANIVCDYRGGGGNTIADEFIEIQNQKERICLCIVDSDRIAIGGKIGNTANRIKSESNVNCVITEFLIIDLHEAENLIPNSLLSSLCSSDISKQKALILLEKIQGSSVSDIRGFLDIKNGTSMKKILDIESLNDKEFWNRRLTKIPDIFDRVKPYCFSEKYCIESDNKRCCCRISFGFGMNILEQTVKQLNEMSDHEVSRKVTGDMREEWEKIGQIILNWCFAESPIRAG